MAASNILDYYARLHTPFLHGAGLTATNQLICAAKITEPAKLLEIGCGTGASLVHLAHNFPQLELLGVDISPLMLAKANKRVGICGLSSSIQLQQLNIGQALPFPDDQFDYIWIESVLAIQTTANLLQLFSEIKRVLRPGGQLLMNETLWLDAAPINERQRINRFCTEHWGIQQANAEWASYSKWQALLQEYGFGISYFSTLEEKDQYAPGCLLKRNYKSAFFDNMGKIKRLIHPKRRRETRTLQALESQVFRTDKQQLDVFLMIAKNSSTSFAQQ